MSSQNKRGADSPEICNKTLEEIDGLIDRISTGGELSEEQRSLIIGSIRFSTWMPARLKEKDITIKQLQNLIFGQQGKKKKKKKGTNASKGVKGQEANPTAANEPASKADEHSNITTTDSSRPEGPKKKPGHGRIAHEAYTAATQQSLSHSLLSVGDYCPELCGGKLYFLKAGNIISITGSPIATATHYQIEKLRCALCGRLFSASLPDGVNIEKYDARFKALLVLQKYYMGIPFYRQARYLSYLNVPVPASTQFDLVEQVANPAYPVFNALKELAATGDLVHADDTRLKILDVIANNKARPEKERTGMYTTGILSRVQLAGQMRQITLYINGRQHAGENMRDVLAHRNPHAEALMYMVDASSMNTALPEGLKIILANCLDHAFRKFRDLIDYYPTECLYIIHELGKIYEVESECQRNGYDDETRLSAHQTRSAPVMTALKLFVQALLDDHKVEPNSNLGKAIKYLLKHWPKLTQFLKHPGCPLSNSILERALKIPIRVRKNSMFYKTEHGAVIGSILTSLIQTAIGAKQNPVDYLCALQDHRKLVRQTPSDWFPWSYQRTLEQLTEPIKKAA